MIDHLNSSFFFKISIYETYYFSRERGFDWHILSGLWVFYAGFFASPYTQIFYPDFESFTKGFYPHPRVSASPIVKIFYPAYQRYIPGFLLHPRVSASPIIQIFYPDFESFMPGFLLHHTLRYFIPTLSLLRRVLGLTLQSDFIPRISAVCSGWVFYGWVPGLTLQSDFLCWLWVFYAGCLVSPYSLILYPAYQRCVRGESFMDGCLVSPYSQIFYPDFESFTPGAWSHPTVRYFIRTLCLLRRVFFFTIHSDILSRLWVFYSGCLVSPYSLILYPAYQRCVPGESFTDGCPVSHPSLTYFIRTLSLLRR